MSETRTGKTEKQAPKTHRAWKLNGRHSFDCLKIEEVETPVPEGSQVLIKVKSASLNYRDVAIIHETYPSPVKDDLIPLSDASGEVVSVGSGVSNFKVGDKVMPTCMTDWIAGRRPQAPPEQTKSLGNISDGVLQEYMLVDEHGLVAMPSNYSFVEGSTLACAAVTAWNALFGLRRVMPGDWVLVEGTGGVSLFALQFAKAAGARVVATTSSPSKSPILSSLGADHILNYRSDPDWGTSARKLTPNGVGFDHIIDVGGPATLQEAIKAIASDGVISLIGFLSKGESPDLMQSLYKGFVSRGIGIGSRVQFEEMVKCIEANEIKPQVDKVFKFEEAKEAYKHLEGGSFTGKVVIEI